MARRFVWASLFAGVLLSLSPVGLSQDEPIDDEAEADGLTVFGFIELNQFSDRGLARFSMNRLDPLENTDPQEDERFADLMVSVNTAASYLESLPSVPAPDGRPVLERPFSRELLAGLEPEARLRVCVVRFSRYGLVELFHPELQRLLDRPLEERPVLMKRLWAVAEKSNAIYQYLFFARDRKRSEILVAAAELRRLSRQFDHAILKALSDVERTRVATLVDLSAPVWLQIDDINRESVASPHPPPFGSLNLAGLRDADADIDRGATKNTSPDETGEVSGERKR